MVSEPPDEQPALLTRAEARGEGSNQSRQPLLTDEQVEQIKARLADVAPSARTMINMQHQGRVIE